jgi:hypothetical protein
MLKSGKATNGGRARRDGHSRRVLARSLLQDSVPHDLTRSRGWRSPPPAGRSIVPHAQRVEEEEAAATVLHGPALVDIDAFQGCDAIRKGTRAAAIAAAI